MKNIRQSGIMTKVDDKVWGKVKMIVSQDVVHDFVWSLYDKVSMKLFNIRNQYE